MVLESKDPNLQATPRLKRGPKPKPPSERKSKPFSPLKRKEETHSHEKKVRVLLFLINHRIYDPNANSRGSQRGQLIDGYRQPYLSEAAKWFLVKKQTIHEWWKQRDKILGITPKETTWRPKWPELEDELFRRFIQRRSEKKIVTVSWFRTTAKHLFGELYPEHEQLFGFSNGWFLNFKKRHRIVKRRIANQAQKTPEEYRAIFNSFLRFLRRNTQRRTPPSPEVPPKFPPRPYEKIPDILDSPQRRFHNNCILNVDETPVPFEYLDGSTYALSGEKTVSGKTDRSGWSKRKGTLILPIFADRFGRLKPKLIFEGAEPPKGKILQREGHLYHPGVTVELNPTAYNNEKLFLKWLNEEVIPCKRPYREFMLVMDVASFHKTDNVTMLLGQSKILPAMIPPGCTSLLQPLDVSINKPFKQWLQQFADEWIAERDNDPVRSSKPWTATEKRAMTTHIVAKAWEQLQERPEMVEKEFYSCGIGLRPDGSEENLISIKDIRKEEIDFTN
ncbi:DDE-1 domain-containing protein [Fusarium keratoplasticum]|uniref:DDE-1 domain-containing protein n=1 Tax=Fusarium keratoplasticum TaxID=1328300 RepID=A0ACC0QEA1_9HYPO|nr:DDE-1 domain-containing protein [Fusarium keratoplasticum]KAI8648651.1 DDE-1 domain-containing protein [Fusarium keratoplasticum]